MSPELSEWLQILFRWLHVVAGILWIGHLYFFNFVNAQVAKTYDADSKKKVVPELMPRALYWFRWGAAWTWITGFLLAGLIYYMNKGLMIDPADSSGLSQGVLAGISFTLIVLVFFIYDAVWRALASKETVGAIISFLLLAIVMVGLSRVMAGRAVYIHLGMLFGTIMAMNVWMRIWPNQRRIISAIKSGTAPDAAWVAIAGLRSKHNTYMSVPLVYSMISNHHSGAFGSEANWIILLAMVLGGWALVKFFYVKSAGPTPGKIE